MSGRGGAREGAGRPKGGISQLQRVLNQAMLDGMAHAAESAGITEGEKEEKATQCAAMIISDMITSGRGDEVLKLGVVAAAKESKEPENGKGSGSAVMDALMKMSGLKASNQSQGELIEQENAEETNTCQAGATHNDYEGLPKAGKNGFYFEKQSTLFLPAGSSGEQEQGDQLAPPQPPLRVAPTSL